MQAPVPKLSRTPGRVATSGPALGEATDEILRGLLGLSDLEIADMRVKEVICTRCFASAPRLSYAVATACS
jgi:succinyl-CoA:(S)-malate CoA-transferase subunit B